MYFEQVITEKQTPKGWRKRGILNRPEWPVHSTLPLIEPLWHTIQRHSYPLRHNIYSTIYRLISLYISDWSSVFYIYLASFTFVHFLFTRFKISLSLHLYNINSTVLSHGPAASLEASTWDSSLIICLYFIHQLTSLSHRAANWQTGSNMHQKSRCGFSLSVCEGSWMTKWRWSSYFTLMREVLRSAAPQQGV